MMPLPVRLPSFDSLRCFLAGAEQLNFRRAASAVGLTPAAFSQRIKQLEDELGLTLFDRSSRHVELTLDGQALVPRATAALRALQACAELQPGPVRFLLGTRFELGMSWVVPAIVDLGCEPSQWHVDLAFGSGPEIVERLERGTVDAIVTSAPSVHADWSAEMLHPETYAFVGAPVLLERLGLDSPQDARAHCLLDVDPTLPLARYLVSVCEGLSFRTVRQCGTGAAVRARVLAGHGVAVLPRYMIEADLVAHRLRVLLPEVELLTDSFRLVYRTASPIAASLRAFGGYLAGRPLS
jgi:DNA-binding transcriptional LysR family regulator